MATKSAPKGGANPPNQTLYVSNLPDKMQKADLRKNLYFLFTAYGPVLDIVALKTAKMRGQAHIVFRDVDAAAQAMRALQGFDFFSKPMRIAYASGKSDTISKLDGTYKIPVTVQTTSTGAETGERSELQQSIFSAPPGKAPATKETVAATPAKADEGHGVKRPRDEEEDQSMDEDDEGAEMEMDESD